MRREMQCVNRNVLWLWPSEAQRFEGSSHWFSFLPKSLDITKLFHTSSNYSVPLASADGFGKHLAGLDPLNHRGWLPWHILTASIFLRHRKIVDPLRQTCRFPKVTCPPWRQTIRKQKWDLENGDMSVFGERRVFHRTFTDVFVVSLFHQRLWRPAGGAPSIVLRSSHATLHSVGLVWKAMRAGRTHGSLMVSRLFGCEILWNHWHFSLTWMKQILIRVLCNCTSSSGHGARCKCRAKSR